MYVINGIPEFRKMGTGIPIFDLNGFRVFRFDFPPESSGIPNSEAEFRIPVVPGNGISKRNSQPRKPLAPESAIPVWEDGIWVGLWTDAVDRA
jgi:hypothetical protein